MKRLLLPFITMIIMVSILLNSCGSEETNKTSLDDVNSDNVASEMVSVEPSEEISEDVSEEVSTEWFKNPDIVGYTQYNNPVLRTGADPYVLKHGDKYYYCFSAGERIWIKEFDSLGNISNDGATAVFAPPAGTEYSCNMWAPELHYIDGVWYIYFAADDGNNDNHRMFVLKCEEESPLNTFVMCGKITDKTDKWAIDGTVFNYKGEYYYVWSGWDGTANIQQNLYIAKMISPTELEEKRVKISKPEYAWEKQGGGCLVNEGPYVIVKGDYIAILYSASGSWCDDYCIGQLTFKGGEVTSAKSWEKHSEPIMHTNNGIYGPGHCSVTEDENGVMWMVFHGNSEPNQSWAGRHVWMYPLRVNKKTGIIKVVTYSNPK